MKMRELTYLKKISFLGLRPTGEQNFRIYRVCFLIRQLSLGFAGAHMNDIFLLIVTFAMNVTGFFFSFHNPLVLPNLASVLQCLPLTCSIRFSFVS